APPRFAVARWDFISILLTAKRVKSLIYAGGRRSFREWANFFARRGNLVKTRKHILTISLFRRGARFGLRGLASGRPGPTSRGREMLTHFN
ncbi:hypothetical protein, partial [uncultured Rikenella sp.]|uniref:hypothetical protein n=1 Tax=uncultured Rikenella sp. TaxID=368003 RepID=UPI0025D7624D